MKRIYDWLNDSLYTKPLSPACKMCAQGSKMVVLITGLCPLNCFYCPLSFKKGGKDVIFADEWKLYNEKDVSKLLSEAEYVDATGAGITGGDPLVVWKRTEKYISILKEKFGSKFHIHLYTCGLKNVYKVPKLVSAGLDEIRFHPKSEFWKNMDKNPIKKSIIDTIGLDVDVAIEIPVIPNMENEIINLIKWSNSHNISWINLNELEFSERNNKELKSRGYLTKEDISAAVEGSQETAYKILKLLHKEDLDIGIHYCSVSFKDGIQLRNRIKRRAKNILKEYEVITDDGTLIKGVIYPKNYSLNKIIVLLKKEYDVPEKYLFVDTEKNRVEIGLWILEKISKDLIKLGFECFMVEEYPTADRLEVEKIPLPFS